MTFKIVSWVLPTFSSPTFGCECMRKVLDELMDGGVLIFRIRHLKTSI